MRATGYQNNAWMGAVVASRAQTSPSLRASRPTGSCARHHRWLHHHHERAKLAFRCVPFLPKPEATRSKICDWCEGIYFCRSFCVDPQDARWIHKQAAEPNDYCTEVLSRIGRNLWHSRCWRIGPWQIHFMLSGCRIHYVRRACIVDLSLRSLVGSTTAGFAVG